MVEALVTCFSFAVWLPTVAQTNANTGPVISTEPVANEVEQEMLEPSIELLEFLGQWVTDEGQWIDPNDLASEEFAQLLEAALTEEKQDDDN